MMPWPMLRLYFWTPVHYHVVFKTIPLSDTGSICFNKWTNGYSIWSLKKIPSQTIGIQDRKSLFPTSISANKKCDAKVQNSIISYW
jgi:hypothetical protein